MLYITAGDGEVYCGTYGPNDLTVPLVGSVGLLDSGASLNS
jgi:hypothetical protein